MMLFHAGPWLFTDGVELSNDGCMCVDSKRKGADELATVPDTSLH
jgi:hypothetical protein